MADPITATIRIVRTTEVGVDFIIFTESTPRDAEGNPVTRAWHVDLPMNLDGTLQYVGTDLIQYLRGFVSFGDLERERLKKLGQVDMSGVQALVGVDHVVTYIPPSAARVVQGPSVPVTRTP